MKADQIILEEADKVKQEIQIPYESKKLLMQTVPFRGHTMFEINCTTTEINPVQYEETSAQLNGVIRKKIIIHDNCVYISCLNKKSALKKYIKWLHQKLTQKK